MSTKDENQNEGSQALQLRWYCLSANGMATLALDKADAENVAAESDQLYPRNGPHVAVQMVPVQPDGRGTDAQIEKERGIARHAIVGALAAGYAGQDHPGTEHWLAAAHDAGVRIAELEKHARQQAAPMPPHTLALMADIDMIELHDENGPGRVFCPACGAYMQMQWKAGKRTDEVENLPHDEKCPAVWARAQLAHGITAPAGGEG